MIMPIGDDNSDRTLTPVVNYCLIAANIFVFVLFQGLGENEKFTYKFATVPEEIVSGHDIVTADHVEKEPISGQPFKVPGLEPTPGTVYITLLTSMFMHGGVAHIFGNMLFLWIFGDNVEDALGHVRYLLFYLITGVLASLSHVFTTIAVYGANSPESLVPSLGASGAISGVLGGYLLLYPNRRVTVIMFRILTQVPSYVAIGLWFLFQLVSGLGMFGGGSQAGGVAYAAHIGGFVAGLLLVRLFAIGSPVGTPATGYNDRDNYGS
jgi:membrane associated rhomboid family serine protease